MAKLDQDRFLVEYQSKTGLLAVSGYWQTFSGGSMDAGGRKSWDGGADEPELVASAKREHDNVTIGREFDPERDGDIVRAARSAGNKERGTLSVTPIDPDGTPTGDADIYTVMLTKLTPPEADASSKGDAAKYSLEFMVGSVQ